MTDNEIVRSYRSAKFKKEQIKILAELTCKPREQIKSILVAAGETIPTSEKKPKRDLIHDKKEEKLMQIEINRENGMIIAAETVEKTQPKKLRAMPEHVRLALTNELKNLDAQIEEIQKKKEQIIDYLLDRGEVNEEKP